jgi:type II secretory pathway component PulK
MKKDGSFSTRSSFRGRTERGQRGFVLVSVLLLALLYFGLMELMLADAASKLREAHRFRSRIVANILAENAVELAAARMLDHGSSEAEGKTPEGTMAGTYQRLENDHYVLQGEGRTSGITPTTRRVEIRGRIIGQSIRIDASRH